MAHEPPAHTKATRSDWLAAARLVLVEAGVQSIKISRLATDLGVGRASFYWYFKDRAALLDALLDDWSSANIHPFIQRAERETDTIVDSVLAVFECWVDPDLFDAQLEFAIREWARRDPVVREQLESADQARMDALEAMHRRHGASPEDALVRARVHYHSQIGLYALGQIDPTPRRNELVAHYLRVFTGEDPSLEQVRRFQHYALELDGLREGADR